MDKNEYFYEFQKALDKSLGVPKIKRNRVLLIQYFQEHWETCVGNLSGAEFLQEAINQVCIEKPRGRKAK